MLYYAYIIGHITICHLISSFISEIFAIARSLYIVYIRHYICMHTLWADITIHIHRRNIIYVC